MTAPQGGQVRTTPGALPNFNAAPVTSGDPTNIWNLPTDLQAPVGAAGPVKLWYDIRPASKGHTVEIPSAPVGGSSGDISELNPAVPGTGTHDVTVGAHGSAMNMETPADILKSMAALSFNDPQHFMNLQALLANGAWGTVNVNGVFDSHTQKALIDAMVQYHRATKSTGAAMSFMQYLQSAGTTAALAKQQAVLGKAAAAPVALQDPATIATAAQNAAQQALGENLSQDQVNKFVMQFQAEQQAVKLNMLQSGSNTYTTPDLSSQAMAFVQSTNPQDYQQNQRQQYLDALVNMMGGNRPSASNADITAPVKSQGSAP